jgi:hypothetical protein
MRAKLFDLTPEMIGLPQDSREPLAALMEIGLPEAAYTLVCVADGAASIYFSSGGGIIGAGGHEPVRAASLSMLQRTSSLASQWTPTETFPLPQRNSVRFYLITPTAIRTAEATEEEITAGRHPLHALFVAGNEVIAAIREHTPQD